MGNPYCSSCKLTTGGQIVTLPLPVESAMHVSIIGDDSMPRWSFTAGGAAFTVAVHAYLTLGYLTLPSGDLSLLRGGEVSLDHVHLQRTQLGVAGSLAVSSSQLDDVAFVTAAEAVISMDAVTVVGTGAQPLSLSLRCPASISGGEIRNAELQVASTGAVSLTGVSFRVEGMAVSVAAGGSLTVSASQLLHGGIADPFPCNGADMGCSGAHSGAVEVAGPASINTAAPLVCADETAGSCLSGYVDMPSCLADISRGMASCFVYLQQDAAALGAVTAAGGQYFEVHGGHDSLGPAPPASAGNAECWSGEYTASHCCDAANGPTGDVRCWSGSFDFHFCCPHAPPPPPLLQLQADWTVSSSAAVTLAELWLVGGGGSGGSQLSVEAGGQLTLRAVQMQDGIVSFSGAVSVSDCVLASSRLLGTAEAASLNLSGGTVTDSTVSLGSGTATVGGSIVLTNSPISISGGALEISHCELLSDGSAVPLAIEAGAAAAVSGAVFRSTGGSITAVSVAEGGRLTVGESQLVGADGSADPFPCDGTLPDCAGAHDGSVVVDGPSAINMAAPLVCDAETGACPRLV